MVGFFDVKYYKWIAAIVGWYFAGILGAIIAYSIVSRYTRRLTTDISFEIALLRICSMIIKSDGNVERKMMPAQSPAPISPGWIAKNRELVFT